MKVRSIVGGWFSLCVILVMYITTTVYGFELSEKTDIGISEGVYGYTEIRAQVVVEEETTMNPDSIPPEQASPTPEVDDKENHSQTGNSYPIFWILIFFLSGGISIMAYKIRTVQ